MCPPWIPVPKKLIKDMLRQIHRNYTEEEAYLSVALDADAKKSVTTLGYAKLWGWSRNRVEGFFLKIGVEIERNKDTSKIKNQRGHISPISPDKYQGNDDHIKLFIFNDLKWSEDNCRANNGQILSINHSATSNTKNKTNKKNTSTYADSKENTLDETASSPEEDEGCGGDVSLWLDLARRHMDIPRGALKENYLDGALRRIQGTGITSADQRDIELWQSRDVKMLERMVDQAELKEKEDLELEEIKAEEDLLWDRFLNLPESERNFVSDLAAKRGPSPGKQFWRGMIAYIMRNYKSPYIHG